MAEAMSHHTSVPLPHNLELERSLLGAVIFEPSLMDRVLEALPPTAIQAATGRVVEARRGAPQAEPLFFGAANQIVFGTLVAMHDGGQPIDLLTLGEALGVRGQLESVGGSAYLAMLAEYAYAAEQAEEYARIVAEKWRLRMLIRSAQRIAAEAAAAEGPAGDVIDRAEKQIFDISQEQRQTDFEHVAELVETMMMGIADRQKGIREPEGVMTSFPTLDAKTGGFRPANLVIIAARPSMGKTSFAMNIASHVAIKNKIPVGIFSLEMSKSELLMRLLCNEARVQMGIVRNARDLRLSDHQQTALSEAAQRIHQAPLYIDDTSALTILEMRAKARRLKSLAPELGMIVIDYLQLMTGGGKRYDNRQHEVSEISRALKGLARELQIPVVALSQLSRQSEQRRGKEEKIPRLSDLRESGAIEQDADLVLFIHRERDMSADKGPEPVEDAVVRIGKQRNGEVGDIKMNFYGAYTWFSEKAFQES
jgi:replicative DNA helicase